MGASWSSRDPTAPEQADPEVLGEEHDLSVNHDPRMWSCSNCKDFIRSVLLTASSSSRHSGGIAVNEDGVAVNEEEDPFDVSPEEEGGGPESRVAEDHGLLDATDERTSMVRWLRDCLLSQLPPLPRDEKHKLTTFLAGFDLPLLALVKSCADGTVEEWMHVDSTLGNAGREYSALLAQAVSKVVLQVAAMTPTDPAAAQVRPLVPTRGRREVGWLRGAKHVWWRAGGEKDEVTAPGPALAMPDRFPGTWEPMYGIWGTVDETGLNTRVRNFLMSFHHRWAGHCIFICRTNPSGFSVGLKRFLWAAKIASTNPVGLWEDSMALFLNGPLVVSTAGGSGGTLGVPSFLFGGALAKWSLAELRQMEIGLREKLEAGGNILPYGANKPPRTQEPTSTGLLMGGVYVALLTGFRQGVWVTRGGESGEQWCRDSVERCGSWFLRLRRERTEAELVEEVRSGNFRRMVAAVDARLTDPLQQQLQAWLRARVSGAEWYANAVSSTSRIDLLTVEMTLASVLVAMFVAEFLGGQKLGQFFDLHVGQLFFSGRKAGGSSGQNRCDMGHLLCLYETHTGGSTVKKDAPTSIPTVPVGRGTSIDDVVADGVLSTSARGGPPRSPTSLYKPPTLSSLASNELAEPEVDSTANNAHTQLRRRITPFLGTKEIPTAAATSASSSSISSEATSASSSSISSEATTRSAPNEPPANGQSVSVPSSAQATTTLNLKEVSDLPAELLAQIAPHLMLVEEIPGGAGGIFARNKDTSPPVALSELLSANSEQQVLSESSSSALSPEFRFLRILGVFDQFCPTASARSGSGSTVGPPEAKPNPLNINPLSHLPMFQTSPPSSMLQRPPAQPKQPKRTITAFTGCEEWQYSLPLEITSNCRIPAARRAYARLLMTGYDAVFTGCLIRGRSLTDVLDDGADAADGGLLSTGLVQFAEDGRFWRLCVRARSLLDVACLDGVRAVLEYRMTQWLGAYRATYSQQDALDMATYNAPTTYVAAATGLAWRDFLQTVRMLNAKESTFPSVVHDVFYARHTISELGHTAVSVQDAIAGAQFAAEKLQGGKSTSSNKTLCSSCAVFLTAHEVLMHSLLPSALRLDGVGVGPSPPLYTAGPVVQRLDDDAVMRNVIMEPVSTRDDRDDSDGEDIEIDAEAEWAATQVREWEAEWDAEWADGEEIDAEAEWAAAQVRGVQASAFQQKGSSAVTPEIRARKAERRMRKALKALKDSSQSTAVSSSQEDKIPSVEIFRRSSPKFLSAIDNDLYQKATSLRRRTDRNAPECHVCFAPASGDLHLVTPPCPQCKTRFHQTCVTMQARQAGCVGLTRCNKCRFETDYCLYHSVFKDDGKQESEPAFKDAFCPGLHDFMLLGGANGNAAAEQGGGGLI